MGSVNHRFLILLFFFLLFVGLTFPLILNIDRAIYGFPHDNLGSLWGMWAYQTSFEQGIQMNPFPYLNFPGGMEFHSKVVMYFSEGLDIAFAWLFPSTTTAWNALFISKLSFAGFFMFLLVRQLTGLTMVAVLCGVAYAMNPYMSSVSKAYGPYHVAMLLPLMAYTLARLIDRPSFGRAGIAGLVGLLFFSENYYYTYFFAVTFCLSVTVFFFLNLLRKPSRTDLLRWIWQQVPRALLVLGVVLLGATLYMVPHIKEFFESRPNSHEYPLAEAAKRGAIPMFFGIPSIDHFFFGERLSEFYWSQRGDRDTFEMSQFLGYSPLIIVGLALLFLKKMAKATRQWLVYLVIFTGTAMMLSFGPLLKGDLVGGSGAWPSIGQYFYELAPMFRHGSRYQMIVMLGLCACVGVSLHGLLQIQKVRFQKVMIPLTGMVLMFEYNSFHPSFVLDLRKGMPQAYKVLEKDPNSYGILEYPNQWWRLRSHYTSFQIFHGKKLEYTPDLRPRHKPFELNHQQKAYQEGYRYLVVNKDLPPVTRYPFSPRSANQGVAGFESRAGFGYLKRVGDWPDSTLYALTDEFQPEGTLITMGDGFYLDHDQGSAFKWTSAKKSKLELVTKEKTNLVWTFKARSLTKKQLTIKFDGVEVGAIEVGPEMTSYRIPIQSNRKTGELELLLGGDLDHVATVLGNQDQRNVGVFLGQFQVHRAGL